MLNGPHLSKGSNPPALSDEKLRLYSMRFCPYAQRVHLILDAKQIPYNVTFINLNEKPEWYTTKSPLGKVPALDLGKKDGNFHLYESLVIADYLDEKYPQKQLHPKDALSKAKDKLLTERFNAIIVALTRLFSSTNGPSGAPGALTEIVNGLDSYETELKSRGTPYFGGKHPGMLDYMIWPWCERADMLKLLVGDKYELDKERFEKLLSWNELMKSDPAVKVTYLSAEVHAKFWQSRKEGEPNYDLLM